MDAAGHAPASLLPRPMRVARVVTEMAGTVTLEIEAGAFPFAPGQFVMVSSPGVGEVPISISGDPDGDTPLALTIRAVGATTRALAEVEAGSWLGIRGPYGTAWPDIPAGDLLLMAGGLGLAPLRGAFLRALRAEERIDRVILLYGTREPGMILFDRELLGWMRQTRAEIHVTVDQAHPGWTGNVGLITTLLERERLDASSTTALLCGPEVMMRLSARELAARGVPTDHIHLSLERHMACATAQCGRCQLGPLILCRDGPVVRHSDVGQALAIAEL